LHISDIGPNRRKIKSLINYLLFAGKSHVTEHSRVLLTITQGKFHQVKHMFRAESNRVKRLHREKINQISLDVELGQWRYVTSDEINTFE
jgi:16S rRNA pseudouridine516 synthase